MFSIPGMGSMFGGGGLSGLSSMLPFAQAATGLLGMGGAMPQNSAFSDLPNLLSGGGAGGFPGADCSPQKQISPFGGSMFGELASGFQSFMSGGL